MTQIVHLLNNRPWVSLDGVNPPVCGENGIQNLVEKGFEIGTSLSKAIGCHPFAMALGHSVTIHFSELRTLRIFGSYICNFSEELFI